MSQSMATDGHLTLCGGETVPLVIHCRYCRGKRPLNATHHCVGCGMPVHKARQKVYPRTGNCPCPKCGSRNSRRLRGAWRTCVTCAGEFTEVGQCNGER